MLNGIMWVLRSPVPLGQAHTALPGHDQLPAHASLKATRNGIWEMIEA